MPEISLADLLQATGGKLLQGDPATRVATFDIDTSDTPDANFEINNDRLAVVRLTESQPRPGFSGS